MRPRVSVVWLNYNSVKSLGLVLGSLKSLFELDYDNHEIIVVDNASTDGSFEAVRDFVERFKPSDVRLRVVRSDRNRGYSGGMNLGWTARDPQSKYVVFLNNDLIVEAFSLREIVEFMESDVNVGAGSGLIYYGDGRTIYSAGGVVTELWNAGGVCWSLPEHECYGKDRPHYVTYADGAYMVVNTEIVKKAGVCGKPFLDKAFLYFDDYVLGLLLWNMGYKVRYYPVKAGLHHVHTTIKPVVNYFGIRAHIALMSVVKTRFRPIASLHLLRRLSTHSALCVRGVQKSCEAVRSIYDGLSLGNYAKQHIGTLTIYKAPYLNSTRDELGCFILGVCKELRVAFDSIVYTAGREKRF
jgi:GT2 family glycosyltransferase